MEQKNILTVIWLIIAPLTFNLIFVIGFKAILLLAFVWLLNQIKITLQKIEKNEQQLL